MKKTIGALAAALFLTFSASAADLPAIDLSNPKAVLPNDKDVKIGKLPNGLTYYIRKNGTPENRMYLRLVNNVGALQEDDDQNGLAHFLEHMAFNGSKHFPKNQLIDVLEKSGLRFGGDVNAGTNFEVTFFDLPIPANDEALVNNCFQVLQDWAHYLSLDDDQIDGERGVIISEWRQRMSAQGRLRNTHFKKLFQNSIVAKRNVIGDTNILRHFKYDAIKRFYSDWYRPDLQAIVAVGDFDVNKIEAKIKEYFGSLPTPKNPRVKEAVKVPYHKETLVSIAKDPELTQEQVSLYFKLNEYDHSTYEGAREDIKRQIFDNMFGKRVSEVSRKANPPYLSGSGGEGNFLADVRVFSLTAGTKPGSVMQGAEAILTEAVRVAQHGFSETEFTRAKNQILSGLESSFNEKNTRENEEFVEAYMTGFLQNEPVPGIEFELALFKELLPKISLNEVNDLAKIYLRKENTVITLSLPDNDKSSSVSESDVLNMLDKTLSTKTEPYVDKSAGKALFTKNVTPGKVTSEKKFEKLGITEWTLSNGAKVVLKPTNFKDDEISFEAFSEGGLSKIDDKDLWNAKFASTIVTLSGIDQYDYTTLGKILSGKMVGMSTYIDDLKEGMSGGSSKKDLETMFQLANLYFTAPRLDGEAYESLMSKLTPNIANRANSPDEAFSDSVQAVLYKYNVRQKAITPEVLNYINKDRAFEIYKERFADASGFTFSFVGDFNLETIKPLIEKYLGSLPSSNTKEKWVDRKVRMTNKASECKFEFGKEDRAHVRLMIPGEFNWSVKDRHEIRSLVEAYDIKFTEIVREKLSGVYSPAIYVSTNKYPVGTYNIVVDFVTDPKRIDEMVKATKDLMEGFKKELDAERTEKVKLAQIKEREVSIKTNDFWAGTLSSYLFNGDNYEDIYKYETCINDLKPADIKAAAKKYFNTNKMVKIIMQPTNKS